MRTGSCLVLALAAAIVWGPETLAEEYPTRPVKIIVGTLPGGGIDTMARMLATKLSELLGQQFVVENKAGGGGTMGAVFVANAEPNGYTLLVGETSQLEIAPNVMRNLPYNPVADFTPVSLVTTTGLVLVANPNTSIRSLDDLVKAAKANPGKLTYGSSGIGGIHHFSTEVFLHGIGADLTHVPYKGSGQSIQAVLSGEVDLAMTSMTAAQGFIETNKLHLLATTSDRPVAGYPGTPSISSIVRGYDYSVQNGILAPRGLPTEIQAKLSDAIKRAVESPDFVRLMERTPGTIASWMSPADHKDNIIRNLKKYGDAAKLVGLSSE